MSEEQYLTAVSQAGTFGLDSIVSFVFKAAASVKKTNKHSQLRRVGLIKNPEGGEYYVPRGTYAEAVIGCEVKPIHNLIKHTQLRRILQLAVSKYIDRQCDNSGELCVCVCMMMMIMVCVCVCVCVCVYVLA